VRAVRRNTETKASIIHWSRMLGRNNEAEAWLQTQFWRGVLSDYWYRASIWLLEAYPALACPRRALSRQFWLHGEPWVNMVDKRWYSYMSTTTNTRYIRLRLCYIHILNLWDKPKYNKSLCDKYLKQKIYNFIIKFHFYLRQ
jgi:hypothetical protein